MDIKSDELQTEQTLEADEEYVTNGELNTTTKTKKNARKGKSRSIVWNYFDKINDQTLLCRLCKRTFRYFGNTTNAKSHIKRIHPNEIPSVDHIYEVSRKQTDTVQNVVTSESENNMAIQFVYSDPTEQSAMPTKPFVTKLAPPWEGTAVVDGDFVSLKSSSYHGKYVVLLFHPLAFAYENPTEILKFNERLTDFKILNTEVIVCSVDSHFTLLAWNKTSRKMGGLGNVDIPLMSDINRRVSKNYGVFIEESGYSLKATFITDPKGILRHMAVTDLSESCNVTEVLRLIQSFYNNDARHSST